MSQLKSEKTPTEDMIRLYDNVPVSVAAAYLGGGPGIVQSALQQRLAPYGYAIENREKGTWRYQISPGALVKFKRGELPVWPVSDMIDQIMDSIDKIVSLRTKAAVKVLSDGA